MSSMCEMIDCIKSYFKGDLMGVKIKDKQSEVIAYRK